MIASSWSFMGFLLKPCLNLLSVTEDFCGDHNKWVDRRCYLASPQLWVRLLDHLRRVLRFAFPGLTHVNHGSLDQGSPFPQVVWITDLCIPAHRSPAAAVSTVLQTLAQCLLVLLVNTLSLLGGSQLEHTLVFPWDSKLSGCFFCV